MRNFDLAAIDSKEAVLEASKDLEKLNKLIRKRLEYRIATGETLTYWLINGALLLDNYGGFAIFKHDSDIKYPQVMEFTSDLYCKGLITAGGDVDKLPSAFSSCPNCNKIFTVQDVYNYNFQLVGDRVVHKGECADNYYYIDTSLEISKYIILASKRALGYIENVSIKQRNDQKGNFLKISFKAYGYNFEVKINFKSSITVICKNDRIRIKLYEALFCPCCYEPIEKALNEWKESVK